MATGISSAERLPEGDYSISHRTPPPVPAAGPYTTTTVTSGVASDAGHASEAGSVTSERHHRRRGSFGSLLRRSSSQQSAARQHQSNYNSEDVPPVPSLPSAPATRIAQAQQAAAIERTSTSSRKVSSEGGRTMLRKSSKLRAQQEAERLEQERVSRQNAPAPRLPYHNPLPGIDSFGGEDHNNNNAANRTNFSRPGGNPYANHNIPAHMNDNSSSPAYAVRSGASPPGKDSGEYVESHESMTNRGRYSYASSTVGVNVNSPRRVRRRKDPTPFNVLIVGAKNSGKTSFISFLRHSLALPSNKPHSSQPESTVNASKSSFTSHYLETEMDGERVGLTLWDSAGLEKNIVDLQLREMAAFVESKFEETFLEEQKVMRSPGIKDTHIHCVFLILDPVRLDTTVAASQQGTASLANVSGLDDALDLQVMRSLWGKTTVIPVVSKADTLTVGHMAFLKRAVWQSIKSAKMDPLEALELEDDLAEEDEEDSNDDTSDVLDAYSSDSDKPIPKSAKKSTTQQHKRHSSLTAPNLGPADDGTETPYIPMSILSPDPYDLPPYTTIRPGKNDKVGRRFPWGLADPYNDQHCDFTRLRDSIFLEWRGELRELSRTRWYESWRTSRLKNLPGSRQRMVRGVTPVGANPRDGRNFSAASNGGNVPRSVSGGQGLSKAERVMGIEAVNGNGVYARH